MGKYIKYRPEETIRRLIKQRNLGCCISCHEDANIFNMDMCYYFDLGKNKKGEDRKINVCCDTGRALEEWLKLKGE